MKLGQKMLSLLHGKGPQPQSKFTCLSMVDIFQDLTAEELKEIEKATAMTTCAAGKMFYSPNQSGEVMFILNKGKVQIYRMSSEGRKLVIETLGLGVYRETVTTALNSLKREGLIEISRKRVQLNDILGLQNKAEV